MSEPNHSVNDVDESTALRIYDPQFENCPDVDAEEDPRPCISFIIQTDWGPARIRSSFQGFGNRGHWLAIPNEGHVPDRMARETRRDDVRLVDAGPLPDQRDPVGEDPVTGLAIEIVGFGYSVTPWGQRECVECGRPVDATLADRCPDGWLHEECNPSNWEDASLDAFAGGEA